MVWLGPMRIPNLKAAWLLLLAALATVQATGPAPVRHDRVKVRNVKVRETGPRVPLPSTATPRKPADVKDLPSRRITGIKALLLLPGIVRSPAGGLLNGSGGQQTIS